MKSSLLKLSILIFGIASIGSYCFGQGIVSRCEICGLSKNNCKYKGEHPKCKTCGNFTEKCKYKGDHPKCKTCGQLTEKCKYKGKHPQKVKPIDQQLQTNHTENNVATPIDRFLSGYENGYEWIDLGLSVKWATQNIGAKTPTEYGNYFYWCAPSTETNSEWEKYIDNLIGSNDNESDNSKSVEVRNILQSDGYDTAHENWGGSWRLPTKDELEELIDKCQWNWSTDNGVDGYRVTGPNGRSIFLPSGGWMTNGKKTEQTDEQGYYWTGSYKGKNTIQCIGLHFISPLRENQIRFLVGSQNHSAPKGSICYAAPHRGHSVRPVTE